MNLHNLKIIINQEVKFTEKEQNFIKDIYQEYFKKLYGHDIFDPFLKVAEIDNYANTVDIIRNTKDLVVIYKSDKLIGIGRMVKSKNKEIRILELIISEYLKKYRDIWKYVVSYIENYFMSINYKKMYVEIPLKEGPLLVRAIELGFVENPDDIKINKEVYTYIVSKELR